MVSFTTVATAGLVAFSTLIEPTIGAGAVIRAGASLVGGAMSSSSNKGKREVESAAEKQLESNFASCMSNLHSEPPTMKYNADRSVDMGNLPEACMHEVHAYNNQTNIKDLDATHGRIIIKDHNSIHMDQIPADLHKLLEEKLGKPGSKGPKTEPAAPKAATTPKEPATPKPAN
jgi:hypothetical protein